MPIGAPSLLRLFAHNGPLSGLRLGFVLLVALALGVPALLWSAIPPARPRRRARSARSRLRSLSWLAIGFALYSAMERLHPRYTEGFTPAVAAAAGVGVAWLLRDGAPGSALRSLAAVALAVYGALPAGRVEQRLAAASALGAIVAAGGRGPPTPRALRACRSSPQVSRCARAARCRSTSTTA